MKLRLGFVLRVLGTVGGLAYIATKVDLAAARDAFARIPLWAFGAAIALVTLNLVAATMRWRVLMTTYGAATIPPMRKLAHLYFVSTFYNTYLPGAFAGDVGRGIVTRDAFGEQGAAGSLAIVLVERALGLLCLFVLLAVGLLLAPASVDATAFWWWTLLGVAACVALVIGIAISRRIAPQLPRFVGRHAERLPALRDWNAFAIAIVLSLVTQTLTAAAGWVLLAPFGITFTASLLVIPLAAASGYVPITVGGAGVREAVYVTLCAMLFGTAEHDALAAALAFWFANLVVGAGGGIAQLFGRGSTTAEQTASPAPRSD